MPPGSWPEFKELIEKIDQAIGKKGKGKQYEADGPIQEQGVV